MQSISILGRVCHYILVASSYSKVMVMIFSQVLMTRMVSHIVQLAES